MKSIKLHNKPLASETFTYTKPNSYLDHTCTDKDVNKWKSYLFRPSNTDKIRLALTKQLSDLWLMEGRSLFHLVTTYKPYKDRIYRPKDIDTFFTNFYEKYLMYKLAGLHDVNSEYFKSIKPITYTFIHEHESGKFLNERLDGSYEYPERLHHHSIICAHPETFEFFDSMPEINPISDDSKWTHKICTSYIRECEPMTLLYASDSLSRYKDYLVF